MNFFDAQKQAEQMSDAEPDQAQAAYYRKGWGRKAQGFNPGMDSPRRP